MINKRKTVSTAVTLFLITSVAFAQSESSSTDYFVGKWDVLVEDTPSGDAQIVFNLQRYADELIGSITTEGQDCETNINRIEETEDSIKAYWNAQGYNVYIKLNEKDENNMSGSLMNMFASNAERIQKE